MEQHIQLQETRERVAGPAYAGTGCQHARSVY